MPEAVLTVKGSIRQRKVEDLKAHPKNARVHSDEQVALIMNAITEFGFMVPVVVDEDTTILAGHGRWEAAKKLGMTKIPTIDAKHLTDAQKRAFIIADNKLVERGGWDMGLLAAEVVDLHTLDVDISALGISTEEFGEFKRQQKGKDQPGAEDDVPDVEEVAVSRTGDVWVCGRHRLLCGDATSEDDVAKVLNGESVVLCLTDPPWGVGIKYTSYDDTPESLNKLIAAFFPIARKVADRVLLTSGVINQYRYPCPDWTLAWFAGGGPGSGPWGFTCWQPILAYGKDVYLSEGKGRRPDALVLPESADRTLGHPVPKPFKVWKWIMERGSSKEGDIIYDPFIGSGTTIIAAENIGRVCYGIDIDPVYVDVAVKRWQEYTGEKATLENDGRSFDEVAEERATPPPRKRTRARVVPDEADETEGNKT